MTKKAITLKKNIIMILFTMLFVAMTCLCADAAVLKLVDFSSESKPVKIGKYYYKAASVPNEDYTEYTAHFQRSKKKKSGYKDILSGKNIGYEFFTDGKTIYYTSNVKTIMSYNIAKKKAAKIAKISFNKNYHMSMHYGTSSKFYTIVSENANKYGTAYVYCINLKTKKVNRIFATKHLYNRDAQGTTDLLFSIDNASGTQDAFAYNIETGKTTAIMSGITHFLVYAAGGAGYDMLGQKEAFGIYQNGNLHIYKYIFATNQLIDLGSYPVDENTTMMWAGNQIRLRSDNVSWEDSPVVAF